jgi:hypothetical protein
MLFEYFRVSSRVVSSRWIVTRMGLNKSMHRVISRAAECSSIWGWEREMMSHRSISTTHDSDNDSLDSSSMIEFEVPLKSTNDIPSWQAMNLSITIHSTYLFDIVSIGFLLDFGRVIFMLDSMRLRRWFRDQSSTNSSLEYILRRSWTSHLVR